MASLTILRSRSSRQFAVKSPSCSTPISISVGSPPTASILSPEDGSFFVAGDVISYSGSGTDPDDGTLPASAFIWNIDFLHEGHVHPGTPIIGVKSGTFTIPTSGHDFSGNTRYRITLTVTDSSGLTAAQSALVYPRRVNLSFDTAPSLLTVYLDGIAKTIGLSSHEQVLEAALVRPRKVRATAPRRKKAARRKPA